MDPRNLLFWRYTPSRLFFVQGLLGNLSDWIVTHVEKGLDIPVFGHQLLTPHSM